ncbi:caprin-2 isoform X6 [Gallus gallus]|uniref:caprin-2 isoform X6 n=2 Tax=Gallus gallus TaxID=9031 RepID=UPI001AEAF5A4|nr:caprin-2 isoform X6 [Gallus gallus]XP_046757261.1 caprin-2 isoform X6 [Gallus gallus]XP_046757263.1 caprin-2 isoform X6 [Gallus gallus]XP_046757264.1 caprin-2 isoform X6 [Gallus gallus]XP_046764691.1 caprin-2 isoform X6 [Gallus gallus]XP_046764692.1 caprin-2 isoform X6 [Gallus gallus]XP_046764693.1 caprin-2 isoform X6 [Gallus gallus]XP_046764694.1 caprin-2 isoform X6 [Gallus gallus]
MVQLSQAPFRCPSSPSGRSEEGEEKSMKAAKQQVTPAGDSQPSASPLQAALNSAASPSQAYETYIDNGLICLKHKIRNIEKKKLKLEDYKDRLKKGEALNQDQLEAVEKYDEVVHNLEFAKELQKTFSGLSQDLLKAQKKAQRRESLLKLEAEKKKLRTILQVQYVLQNFTQEHVQKDFKGGVNGAIYLPSKELDYLIRFAKLTCPERNESLSVEDQMEQSSLYFWDLLEGSEKPVVGTTYKHMKDLLSKLLDSGYFESIPTPRTTVPVKELEEVHRKSERTRQMSKGEPIKETESLVELMKSEIQPQEVPKPVHQPAAEFCSTSTLPKDPVLRREKLQDLMTQIQGTYNFMQESILDFDKASPSAIGSSQPPSVTPASSPVASKEQKLPSQSDFLQQPLRATESSMTLHGSNTSLASADQTLSGSETEDLVTPQTAQASASLSQETEKYTSQPLYQTNPHISEPLIPKKIEIAQATVPLPSEPQSPLPTSSTSITPVPQGQSFQSPPASSSSVTITAAPFQAMQTVFKVNAPLPPRKDQEVKEDSSYSAGYNQSFSTASTQTPPQSQLQSSHVAEQSSLSQESLSSVNYQPDGAVSVSNGSLAFYPAQTNVIPRPPQPYLNSRGSVRGSARGGRSLANSYRSPGGYKGFDAYRGSPSITNGTYGQLQFPARDYAGMPYSQRDVNYQQCYKRGGITSGPRANSRAGWSDSSQVSSPERDNETFNSGDSGQGDSRSITPVDMPVTSQAATILPVHVYPLPQQMRVAFSAARTSNLAPGTLDQPIVFDLLLNNLGETFDIQLGRFNCPVNGTYVFIFHMLKLAVNVPLYVNLMKNEEVLVSAYANDGAPDHETASNHAVLQLFQGDQIWLRLHRGAIYGSSWKYSTFSGYLLYQD